MAAPELPDHIDTAAEADAHIVERLTNDGTIWVRDANSGQLRPMRLGLTKVSDELTIVVVGDP